MSIQLPERPQHFRPSKLLHRFPPSYLRPTRLGQDDEPRPKTQPTVFIFAPFEGQYVFAGDVLAKGYAFTSIRSEIERVEISMDNGESWQLADLSPNPQPGEWRLWCKQLHLTPGAYHLLVRTFDKDQPGVEANGHSIRFEVFE